MESNKKEFFKIKRYSSFSWGKQGEIIIQKILLGQSVCASVHNLLFLRNIYPSASWKSLILIKYIIYFFPVHASIWFGSTTSDSNLQFFRIGKKSCRDPNTKWGRGFDWGRISTSLRISQWPASNWGKQNRCNFPLES